MAILIQDPNTSITVRVHTSSRITPIITDTNGYAITSYKWELSAANNYLVIHSISAKTPSSEFQNVPQSTIFLDGIEGSNDWANVKFLNGNDKHYLHVNGGTIRFHTTNNIAIITLTVTNEIGETASRNYDVHAYRKKGTRSLAKRFIRDPVGTVKDEVKKIPDRIEEAFRESWRLAGEVFRPAFEFVGIDNKTIIQTGASFSSLAKDEVSKFKENFVANLNEGGDISDYLVRYIGSGNYRSSIRYFDKAKEYGNKYTPTFNINYDNSHLDSVFKEYIKIPAIYDGVVILKKTLTDEDIVIDTQVREYMLVDRELTLNETTNEWYIPNSYNSRILWDRVSYTADLENYNVNIHCHTRYRDYYYYAGFVSGYTNTTTTVKWYYYTELEYYNNSTNTWERDGEKGSVFTQTISYDQVIDRTLKKVMLQNALLVAFNYDTVTSGTTSEYIENIDINYTIKETSTLSWIVEVMFYDSENSDRDRYRTYTFPLKQYPLLQIQKITFDIPILPVIPVIKTRVIELDDVFEKDKILKNISLDYAEDILTSIINSDQESRDKLVDAFLIHGVDVYSQEPANIKYMFNFFENIYSRAVDTNTNFKPIILTIESGNYYQHIKIKNIFTIVESNTGKVGDILSNIEVKEEVSRTSYYTKKYKVLDIEIVYQVNEDVRIRLIVQGLTIQYLIYHESAEELTATQIVPTLRGDTNQPSTFILPVVIGLLNDLDISEKETVLIQSYGLMNFASDAIELEYWETPAFFNFTGGLIQLASMFIDPSNSIGQFLVRLLANAALDWALKEVLSSGASDLEKGVATVLYILGKGKLNGGGDLSTLKNIFVYADAVIGAAQIKINVDALEIQSEYEEFQREKEIELEELEAIQNYDLDPTMLIKYSDIVSPTIEPVKDFKARVKAKPSAVLKAQTVVKLPKGNTIQPVIM